MASGKTVTISFNATVFLEKREDRWAAYVEPFAMTVYGNTREEAENRLKESVEFAVQHSPDLRGYLDSHGVPNCVTEDEPSSFVPYTYLVRARVPSPAQG